MQLIDGDLIWSASDLTAASLCEYGVLRTLDAKLGRASKTAAKVDPLMEQVARLGDKHERDILSELKAGAGNRARQVIELPRLRGSHTLRALELVNADTMAALALHPDVVFQAGFFDGEFLGYADFIEGTDQGWRVCDAKLARQARPKALLQLAAYADQVGRAGLPVAPTAALLLGNGKREEFRLVDVLPVFDERRARLRGILTQHHNEPAAVEWGDERYTACGTCPDCAEAIDQTQDMLLVAGLRMDQRRRFRDQGLCTVADLGQATERPTGMAQGTFDKLTAQARLQVRQLDAGKDADGYPNKVFAELTDTSAVTLATLPEPSLGDIFFDFEGDPMYNEGNLELWGLEYLWGIVEAPLEGAEAGVFRLWWADNSDQERVAFENFMEYVAERRQAHPDMHIYHYAPYEKTALLRLARRFHLHEKELDDLLRLGVLVDLYACVRGAVRISQPSYSIKKLEPLYMERRVDADVAGGDASIVAYHEYRAFKADGDEGQAAQRRKALEDYNGYDCLSTLLLRDWLLAQVLEQAATGTPPLPLGDAEVPEAEEAEEHDPTFLDLMGHSGVSIRAERSPEQQVFAMLAEALGYYRRETAPFWWSHYDRLRLPVEEWEDERDVFRVEGAELVSDWAMAPKAKTKAKRTLRLTGDWAPGSTLAGEVFPIYGAPVPEGVEVPENCVLGFSKSGTVELVEGDDRHVLLCESARASSTSVGTPLALVPGPPPPSGTIEEAITAMAAGATCGRLPERPDVDILCRRPPRLRDGGALPHSDDVIADAVSALTMMESSYVAIQGPPGTGKSWTGARVIKMLVEKYHWRIGVVAQSHAVVENLLNGIVEAGLDQELVGKSKPREKTPTWTVIDDKGPSRARYLAEHHGSGCVLGGTAWTFTAKSLVEPAGLDLIVVDEAGQFSLAPTIGVSIATKRLMLLGDPQQLPQVSQGTHAEPVDDSALGWLLDGHDTIPRELGYFLGTSYRMHPALCQRVSTLSYEGRLSSAPYASLRMLDGVEPGLKVINLPHEHCRTESAEEAAEVLAQIQALIGTAWLDPEKSENPRPLAQADFLVVAPYNAQVNLIRRTLDQAALAGVRVGTVDKFQGQEAPVVLVSMTASSHGDVPRGMGFLLSRNRVNVAVSRAQWLAVLIRSKALTSFMPATTGGLLELGAFIGLCAGGTVTDSLKRRRP
jgi:uncharacterized protein